MIYFGSPMPRDAKFKIKFHFGPDDGHQCDCAIFDWSLNDKFVATLNFNNLETGADVEQGPYDIDPKKYDSSGCGLLIFSFECKADPVICAGSSRPDGGNCHNGANIDVTRYDGEIITRFIDTYKPVELTVCELICGPVDPP